MSHPSGLPADPFAIHAAVIEVYDALRYVIFTAVPTTQNPTGCSPPHVAKQRLDRLSAALKAFPSRRLVPDPFIKKQGPIKLPFNEKWAIAPVIGTSMHDIVVRLAGRVYDQLGVTEIRKFKDPETGAEFEGVVYEDGYEYEDDIQIGEKTVRMKVDCPGPPRCVHYSELPWSAKVWEQLYKAHGSDLCGLWLSGLCNHDPDIYRVALEHEVAIASRHVQSGLIGTKPEVDHNPTNKSNRKAGRKPIDRKKDSQVWDAWESRGHVDYAGLANALGMKKKDVAAAMDRERKRRRNRPEK